MFVAEADRRLLRLMRTRGHAPVVERAVAGFSRLGEHGGLWLAIGACGWVADPPRRSRWARGMVAVLDAYALNTAIKLVVRRRRPQLAGLPPLASTPTQLSFPSAHSATAFAGARFYSRLGLPRVPLYATATATALSRPYLGLHYPSDVIAGAALGSAVAAGLQIAAGEAG
jgi:membrane-associated phospholipid phosphatase